MLRFQQLAIIVGVAWAGIAAMVLAGWTETWPAIFLGALVTLAGLVALKWVADQPFLRPAIAPSAPDEEGGLARAVGETLLDRLPEPVLVLDGQARVQRANAPARELLGDNPVDRPLAAFLRAPSLLDAIDRVGMGSELEVVDLTIRVPVERHLEVHVARIEASGARKSAMLLLFHDMTAIRRAERLRADFVANASHELKTPLTVLSGFIETLEGPARDDDQARARFLAIMREQAGRMGRLVNDLLSLSRIELNEHLAPRDSIDLGVVVRDVVDGLSMLAAQNAMSIEVNLPEAYPPAIGEREELVQIVQNLIDNAIKYGRGGRPILVSLSEPGVVQPGTPPRLVLSVRDFGDGISREHIPRLTERFYRVDAVRSRERGGTGLGLAIVKHIVNRHRGQLLIDSVVGEGSTFTVVLPAVAGVKLNAPRVPNSETIGRSQGQIAI